MYEGNCVLVKKWEGLIQMNIIFWQKHSPPHFAPKSRCVQLLVLVHQIFVPILHSISPAALQETVDSMDRLQGEH